MLPINASIVQGSGIGPASYVVNAADLRTTTPGNRIAKYADDTYLIIPACNVQSRANELDNVEAWAKVNNLRLNRHKSVEIVVTDGRRRRLVDPPPTLHDVSRVTSVKILGVTFTCKLSLSEHVSVIVSACAPTLHALRVLRSHGMNDAALQTIYKADLRCQRMVGLYVSRRSTSVRGCVASRNSSRLLSVRVGHRCATDTEQ